MSDQIGAEVRRVDDEPVGTVFCQKHGWYWSEDGCLDCLAEAEVADNLRLIEGQRGIVSCSIHGTSFWSEDSCPGCDAEAD